jgi:hypothetical protein
MKWCRQGKTEGPGLTRCVHRRSHMNCRGAVGTNPGLRGENAACIPTVEERRPWPVVATLRDGVANPRHTSHPQNNMSHTSKLLNTPSCITCKQKFSKSQNFYSPVLANMNIVSVKKLHAPRTQNSTTSLAGCIRTVQRCQTARVVRDSAAWAPLFVLQH